MSGGLEGLGFLIGLALSRAALTKEDRRARWRRLNREKDRSSNRAWVKRNQPKINAHQRKQRRVLAEWYVRKLLTGGRGAATSEIPAPLLAAKKRHVENLREIRRHAQESAE
jgi:hypothetical protein